MPKALLSFTSIIICIAMLSIITTKVKADNISEIQKQISASGSARVLIVGTPNSSTALEAMLQSFSGTVIPSSSLTGSRAYQVDVGTPELTKLMASEDVADIVYVATPKKPRALKGQGSRPYTINAGELIRLAPPADRSVGRTYIDFRLQAPSVVEPKAIKAPSATASLSVTRKSDIPAAFAPIQPDRVVSPSQLIVILTSSDGLPVSQAVIEDPRVIRSEGFDETGTGNSRRDYLQSDVSIRVVMPASISATNIEIIKPTWNGTQFDLVTIGKAAL